MSDILIRKSGPVGHVTLNRPKALNALTYQMCLDLELALDIWRNDDQIRLILIDAIGDKAFCAGGDIQEMYDTGRAGNYSYGQKFWADEYRLNAKIAQYPKPYVALMQGFTMGGGVGVSCHGSHRVVCETSQIAMPECGIGLIPDVGGSLLLARAPGHIGEYLGTTAARMGPADAIFAGFADHFIPCDTWADLTDRLVETGDIAVLEQFAQTPPPGRLAPLQAQIDQAFAEPDMAQILLALTKGEPDFATKTAKALSRNSPLSMAATIDIIRRVRYENTIEAALLLEYAFTSRAMERGDFIEGIRAAIIDKDRNPEWRHPSVQAVTGADILAMLAPAPAERPSF